MVPWSHPRDLDAGVKDKSSIFPFTESESSVAFPQPLLGTRVKVEVLTRAFNTLPDVAPAQTFWGLFPSSSFSLLQPRRPCCFSRRPNIIN